MKRMRLDIASAVLEAHRLASSTCLWPGWNMMKTPLVFHSQEIAYTVGHPTPPEGYDEMEPVAGRRVHAGPPVPEMAANTVRMITGSLCALVMLPPTPLSDIASFARLILHECFHAHQREGLSAVPLPDYNIMQRYPEADPENNAGSIVENRMLCSALERLSTDTSTSAAARFITVRQARHTELDRKGLAEVSLYEQRSEFNEGTPTYIEVKAGKPVSDLIETLKKSNIAGKWAASKRFYATGAAIALLLDRMMPRWHQRLSEGAHTMQSLLAEAVEHRVPSSAQVLREEGYADILASEESSAMERAAKIETLLSELRSGPGVQVEIIVPELVFTLFDPNNVIVVRNGVRLHTTISGLRGPSGVAVDISRLCLENSEARLLTLRLPEQPGQPARPARAEHEEAGTGYGTALSEPGLRITAPKGILAGLDHDGVYRVRFIT